MHSKSSHLTICSRSARCKPQTPRVSKQAQASKHQSSINQSIAGVDRCVRLACAACLPLAFSSSFPVRPSGAACLAPSCPLPCALPCLALPCLPCALALPCPVLQAPTDALRKLRAGTFIKETREELPHCNPATSDCPLASSFDHFRNVRKPARPRASCRAPRGHGSCSSSSQGGVQLQRALDRQAAMRNAKHLQSAR